MKLIFTSPSRLVALHPVSGIRWDGHTLSGFVLSSFFIPFADGMAATSKLIIIVGSAMCNRGTIFLYIR